MPLLPDRQRPWRAGGGRIRGARAEVDGMIGTVDRVLAEAARRGGGRGSDEGQPVRIGSGWGRPDSGSASGERRQACPEAERSP